MNLHSLPILFLMACTFLLSACAANTDYLEAKTLPPVNLPEGLDKDRLGQLYPVPEQKEIKSPKKFSVPFPPTVGAQEDANAASIQTMDGEFWVANFKPPAETWAQLVNFWQQKKIGLIKRDLGSATMTSNWFAEALQPGSKVRYRLRLEQGLQANTTDIFIYNEKLLSNEQAVSDQVDEVLSDRLHGDLLAKQLVTILNESDTALGDSYLAATIDLPQKVRLAEVDGEPALLSVARESRLDRAFSDILSKDGFTLYGKDKPLNVYYFSAVNASKNPFSGWFDFTGDQSLETILSSLPDEPEVNKLFPDSTRRDTSKKLSGNKGYLLVVRQQQQRTAIYIRDSSGRLLPPGTAIDLLDTIRLRLI
jgi:outer membrane protein assembly factor BamC